MSRGRRQVIQLNEPTRVLYSNEPAHDNEDDDDDSAGDMPTPERLVTEDMIPNRDGAVGQRMPYEIDNKVANFLAEIDALDPGQEVDSSITPAPLKHVEVSPVREKYSPAREKSPARTKPNAYSSMFVKGTPEFVHKPDERRTLSSNKKMEPWPEEPKTDWQQLKDESTNYPYYWNTVTNQVVWDMPSEFSQYLLRQKEYEEKVERGLREGTLDPEKRRKMDTVQEAAAVNTIVKPTKDQNNEVKPHRKHGQHSDDSADSSSDSSDSDHSPSHYSKRDNRKRKTDKTHEVSSSSVESSRAASHDKTKRSVTPELPDSTKTDDSKREPVVKKVEADDSIDFDIDDIDKELELALERKRQELMKMEEKKTEEKKDEVDKSKHKESRKKDERRHRDDDRRDERHRKHGKHRDRDSDRDRKRDESREEKKPKLTLKERLRIEMELKLEKERRKKKAIEDLMARELEQTVGGRSHKRHRDDRDKARKHYHHDDDRGDRRGSRDDYRDYDRGYDCWEERGVRPYDDRFVPPPMMKPPPPTDEMIAYEEERKSQLVDYGHGRSRHDLNGESDGDESRSADFREMEIKKLEALQLAELALSKLEFLEVTKKGLSKLQILLIELETRHQDWQAGGLTTNHFLCKLKEANWQLEQYEASAPPPGWVCCWDRDYRRYFYTHKLTGKNQWDYPDAEDIRLEDEQAKDCKKPHGKSQEPEFEISSTSDKGKSQLMEKEILASMSLPPPPPPPAEEHPSVKSLQLMYGSSSESETEEPVSKKAKKVAETTPDVQNVPLPPEESHKDRKDRHKKKKKKEKSKKKDKDKERNDTGTVAPAGPVYPAGPFQPPPPPEESGTTLSAQPQVTMSATSEVPVYGSFGDVSSGQNDQPLEFGTVAEPGPALYEGMEGVESGVITQGPQITPTTYDQDPYSTAGHGYPETSAAREPANEATYGETSSEAPVGAQQHGGEEKKKKKKDKMGTGSISLKKKHVSSMVQKWQKVKKEVELEEQHRQIREAEIRRKLAELE